MIPQSLLRSSTSPASRSGEDLSSAASSTNTRPHRPIGELQVNVPILFSCGTRQDVRCRARYLIRDRDGESSPNCSMPSWPMPAIQVVLTGVRMPRMNALMERRVQTRRRELLDRTLIWNQRHLLHALREFEAFNNAHRPHRSLNGAPRRPDPSRSPNQANSSSSHILRRDRLGGVLHEYQLPRMTCTDVIIGTRTVQRRLPTWPRRPRRTRHDVAADAGLPPRGGGGTPGSEWDSRTRQERRCRRRAQADRSAGRDIGDGGGRPSLTIWASARLLLRRAGRRWWWAGANMSRSGLSGADARREKRAGADRGSAGVIRVDTCGR